MSGHVPRNTVRGTTRKKAVESCERCREKRIKCNGFQPCDQCTKKSTQCVFAIPPLSASGGNEALAEKLDLVLTRLDKIEQRLDRQSYGNTSNVGAPKSLSMVTEPEKLALQPQARGVLKLNQQTGCFEYYGRTSTFQIASTLGKRSDQPEEAFGDDLVAKKHRTELAQSLPESPGTAPRTLDLDELTSFSDYIVPPNSLRSDWHLQTHIADRHLDNFFRTIHIFLPILDQVRFTSRYSTLREFFDEKRLVLAPPHDSNRPQFVCLLYAVLALGALYEDDHADSSAWASWYFSQAQSMLGRLIDASNLELTQAATFLGAYAQHAIKPNLAYILNGIAARLAYSIGLNVESLHRSLGFEKEEARRTWAIIYVQEVELSLDAGRPMSVRSSDMNMTYPTEQLPSASETRTNAAPVDFIRHLANISKIVRQILKISSVHDEQPILLLEEREALRQQLGRWRESLPNHLSIDDTDSAASGSDCTETSFLHDWRTRQQSSLRIHFNLANIILLRSVVSARKDPDPTSAVYPLITLHRKICLDAARDMITHIHQSFEIAPGLSRWGYYCFYCLQATLILLPQCTDTNAADESFCQRAVDVFEQIRLKASQRCADVVRQYLQKCARSRQKRQKQEGAVQNAATTNGGHRPLLSTSPISSLQQPTRLEPLPYTATDQDPNLVSGTDIDGFNTASINDNNAPWPSISPNTLQTEMYGALYSVDPNDDFYLGHQPYFFGTGGFSNDVFDNDTSDWSQLWNN